LSINTHIDHQTYFGINSQVEIQHERNL
jgi:hypothetical protein